MHISIPVYIPVDVDLSVAVELLTSPVTADAAREAAAGDAGDDVLGLAPPPTGTPDEEEGDRLAPSDLILCGTEAAAAVTGLESRHSVITR